jgi:hypothetical protein
MGRFQKGQPKPPNGGRRRGTPNKRTLVYEALVAKDAKAIVLAVVERAKQGDIATARILIDRFWPARAERAETFTLPPIESVADLVIAMKAVLAQAAEGAIAGDAAERAMAMLSNLRQAYEVVDMAADIEAMRGEIADMRQARETRPWPQ